MRQILQVGFWFVHVPFGRMVILSLHYSQWLTFPTPSCFIIILFFEVFPPASLCILVGLNNAVVFTVPIPLPLFNCSSSFPKVLGDCSKLTNYNWYRHHTHIPLLSFLSWQGTSICLSSSYYFHLFSFESFSHQRKLIVSHRSLSNYKFPQVSRTLLSILADLNNKVFWMLSTRPIIFMSSYPFIDPLVTASRPPIKIGIIFTFMFHRFFFTSLVRIFSYNVRFLTAFCGSL